MIAELIAAALAITLIVTLWWAVDERATRRKLERMLDNYLVPSVTVRTDLSEHVGVGL